MDLLPLYYSKYAAAYVRGEAVAANITLPLPFLQKALDDLTDAETETILEAGRGAGLKLYRFKSTHDDLPRIKRVLGFLRSIEMTNLLDVGSGRGAFLWPCLNAFPGLTVMSVDLLPHRIDMLKTVIQGGISNLHAMVGDICTLPIGDKSYDVVTMLEVLEHIPDTAAAIQTAVRLAKKYVIITVPSKPDDNPEHIHLLTKETLTAMFNRAGCTRLHFDGVSGHLFMVAVLADRRHKHP